MPHENIKIKRKVPREEALEKKPENRQPLVKIQPSFSRDKKMTEKKSLQKKENAQRFAKKPETIVSHTPKNGVFPLFITCQAGLEALVKKDNERLGLSDFHVQDRIVRAHATEKQMYEALVWNRFSNRVYLELASATCTTFDELFALTESIHWKSYLPAGIAIVTEATTIKSTLSHTPSVQSITKKAIVTDLTEDTGTHHLYEDRQGDEAHIQVFIIENTAYILLDITGNALHKRGYRLETGDAPIKETLAAAIVALSGWRFREVLLDPFCGSGTIAIEAAMLARNLAPGMGRRFAIENFEIFNRELFREVRTEVRGKSYESGKYTIFASDIDTEMIRIAKDNARRAGVDHDITFVAEDFFAKNIAEKTTIVTNPPYGVRLENEDDTIFYKNFLEKMESEHIDGGFITSYGCANEENEE